MSLSTILQLRSPMSQRKMVADFAPKPAVEEPVENTENFPLLNDLYENLNGKYSTARGVVEEQGVVESSKMAYNK